MGQKVWVILLVWACLGMTVRAQLKTYPEGLHTGLPHNDDYTVRVRMPGGEWQDVFEYKVQVDLDKPQDASMVQFDMGSPVEVMVKKNNGTVREVTIRPLNNEIAFRQVQNTIFFSLDKPPVPLGGVQWRPPAQFTSFCQSYGEGGLFRGSERRYVLRSRCAPSERLAQQSDTRAKQYYCLSGAGCGAESQITG